DLDRVLAAPPDPRPRERELDRDRLQTRPPHPDFLLRPARPQVRRDGRPRGARDERGLQHPRGRPGGGGGDRSPAWVREARERRHALRAVFKSFPPGLAHVKVPVSSRASAATALTLYAACRPRAVWMLRIALASLRLFGPRALPGRATPWSPPMGP